MISESTQRTLDAEDHRKDYKSIMKFGLEVGLPFCMGLAMFFTQLLLDAGVWSVAWFLVTYVIVAVIVKTFFSH